MISGMAGGTGAFRLFLGRYLTKCSSSVRWGCLFDRSGFITGVASNALSAFSLLEGHRRALVDNSQVSQAPRTASLLVVLLLPRVEHPDKEIRTLF